MEIESNPVNNIDPIDKAIEQIKASGEIVVTPFATFRFPFLSDPRFLNSPFRDEINKLKVPEITIGAAKKTVEELSIKDRPDITTRIPDLDEQRLVIPSLGIGGGASSPTRVEMFIDPLHDKVLDSLEMWKARQVGHELNHCARLKKRGPVQTLLDDIVMEGLGTYYEEHWGGEYLETPWGHMLTEEQLTLEFEKAKPLFDSKKYDHGSWKFGVGGEHPVWTVYSLGTRLVERFFQNNPKTTMREAVRMKSKKILKGSGLQI